MESSIRRTLADDGTATVTVHGEIDYSNCDELAACVRAAVADRAPTTVAVDLHNAGFLDSTGLGALIEGYREAREAGVAFVVTNPTPAFRRVLTVTGLGDFFGLPERAEGDAEPAGSAQATGA
jgi:anti-sigma B factor antagonist